MARQGALLVICSLTFLSRAFTQGPQIITLPFELKTAFRIAPTIQLIAAWIPGPTVDIPVK